MGFSLTYKCNPKQTTQEDNKQVPPTDMLESKVKEIEDKIAILDGCYSCQFEVDIDLFFHKTYKDINKGLLKSKLYEKCLFIHEKEENDSYIMIAFSNSENYCEAYEVEENFKLFLEHGGVYEYKKTIKLKGNIWTMGDFKIRLGILNLGLTNRLILMQVEYGVLSTQKGEVFVEDFTRQLITDEGFEDFTPLKCKLFDIKPEDKIDHTLKDYHRLRQFGIPIIEDDI